MGNILAIDASTKRTGLATMIDGELKYAVIESSSTSVEKRIGIMRDGILNFIKENNISKVIMEDIYGGETEKNEHTRQVLSWLQGCVVVAAYEYDKTIQFEFFKPSSWRSVLGLQGYRVKREIQKQKDIEYANQNYGLNLTSSQDDEADAICILTAYTKDKESVITGKQKKTINEYESAF